MSRKLTVELSDEAYESLVEAGRGKGESPEALASRLLIASFTDPLLRLAGCIKSPIKDIADEHDEYLGRAIMDRHDDSF